MVGRHRERAVRTSKLEQRARCLLRRNLRRLTRAVLLLPSLAAFGLLALPAAAAFGLLVLPLSSLCALELLELRLLRRELRVLLGPVLALLRDGLHLACEFGRLGLLGGSQRRDALLLGRAPLVDLLATLYTTLPLGAEGALLLLESSALRLFLLLHLTAPCSTRQYVSECDQHRLEIGRAHV